MVVQPEPVETTRDASDPSAAKAAARAVWRMGDYDRFAKATIWEVGEQLVRASGVRAGQRVLDVAAGTGNSAIRAALAGADVVASDLTPEHFDAGRREATAQGVAIEWTEGDAEDLPFAAATFDVVLSSFGAIFAPDHQAVADEMVRVCRPGGTIAMANFVPEGLIVDFFDLLATYMPPAPDGASSPLLWGDEAHVRTLFGDRVDLLRTDHRTYVERAEDPMAYRDLYAQMFGPVVALRHQLLDDPARLAALDRDLLDFALAANTGSSEGPAEYPYRYVLVVADVRP